MNTPILQLLDNAASGLLFISESDAPLLPFFWPSDNPHLTPQHFAQMLAQLNRNDQNANIETVTLQHFFRNATQEEEWHDAEEAARAQQFRALVKTLEDTLQNVQVFRVGEIAIDVFIIGETEGGFAGLQTKVVET